MRFPQVSERVKEAPANALRSVFASIGQVLLITDRMKKKPGESGAAPAGGQDPATATATGEAPATTVPAPATPADPTAEAPATPETGAAAGTGEAGAAGVATGTGGAGGAAEALGSSEAAEAIGASGAVGAGGAAEAAEASAQKPAVRKPAAKKPAAQAPAADKPAAKRSTATGNVRVLPEDEAKTTPVTARKPRPRKPTVTGTTAPVPVPAPVPAPIPAPVPAPAPAAAPETPEVVAAPEGPVSSGEAPLPNYDQLTVASLRARLRNLSIDQVRTLIGYERAHADRADVIAMFERRVARLETPES